MIAVPALFLLFVASACDESIKPAALALERGDLASAEATLVSARSRCSASPYYFELSGLLNNLGGNLPAAEDAFRRAVSLNPRSARLLGYLGSIYLRDQKLSEAAQVLEQSAAIDPSDARVLFTLGTLLARQGSFEKAVRYLSQIPEKDADDAVYFNLGLACSRLKQFAKARTAYYKAIDKKSGNVEAYFRVGVDYAVAGEPRKSIPWLFRANDLSSSRPDIVYALAAQLLQLKYVRTAESVVSSALAKNPGDAALKVTNADIERQKGNNAAAVSQYNLIIKENPRVTAAYVGLAEVAMAEGKDDEARKWLLDALAIAPENAIANNRLGVIEGRRGEWRSALSFLSRAWEQDRSNRLVGLDLARALRHTAQLPAALRLLKSLEPDMAESAPFHSELAQVYGQLRRNSEAQEERAVVARIEARSHEGLHFEDSQTYIR